MFSAQIANEKTNWQEILEVLSAMEKGRWSGVYTYDHFIPPLSNTPDTKDFEFDDTLEGWTLLASIAAVTKTLKLGVLVTGVTYRNPALLAKMAATIDVVSQGRVVLGLGAGWNIREHQAYGWHFPDLKERSDRLEEAAELIRNLFNSEGRVTYKGNYYQLNEATFRPAKGGARSIPIMIGGKGEKRTLKTLAMYGDIMNVEAGPEQIRHLSDVLAQHCEVIGRDPNEIKKTVHVPIKIVREKDLDQVNKNTGTNKDWSMIGPPQLVIDRIGAFLDVGVTEFIPYIRPQHPEVYQELDEEVFAAFD